VAQKLEAGMPDSLDIGGGWQIVWAAVDPSTGNDVSGVVISLANVVAVPVTEPTDVAPGDFVLVPGSGFGGTSVE
jgi:hypothetical protein